MSIDHLPARKSFQRLAFEHYLRTGERLTAQEWHARYEAKFNPYHDERGRFTSPPGVTVSYGRGGSGTSSTKLSRSEVGGGHARTSKRNDERRKTASQQGKPIGAPPQSADGFRSEYVRGAVSSATSNADTYFELNRRQAFLNRLRENAGPNPEPSVTADLEDFQRRLDANRALLNTSAQYADQQIAEIMRAGMPPIDFAAGAVNIVSGEAELRDYLSVAGVVPLGGAINKVGKVLKPAAETIEAGAEASQLGGAHWRVKKLADYHSHHIPSKKVSPMREGASPSIAMLPNDHRMTASYGRGADRAAHRKAQADLIEKGDFKGAQQLDIDDIRNKFGGKYDNAIEQMIEYSKKSGIYK